MLAEVEELVAKPKKSEEPKAESEPARKPMIVQVRGSEEYKAWAERLAALEGDTLAKLVDKTFREYAKSRGFESPPKR